MGKVNPALSAVMVKVSVIITVLNEQDSIEPLIASLRHQSRIPDEVIVVDGGSSDQTWPSLKKMASGWKRLRLFQLPSSNRSQARNHAISKARGPIIAITDAGCLPATNWVEEICKPFYSSTTQVVSGYYNGISSNIFQKCLIPYVLVMPDRIPAEFFPSTRSMAMRKSVWVKFGGFNPDNYHSEDYEYAHFLHHQGISFVFAPQAIVSWIPRKNLTQASWMFFRFALGDIQSGIFRPKVKQLFIRYGIFFYLLFLSFEINLIFVPLTLLVFLYLLWSVVKNYRYVKHPLAIYWLPVIQITADLSVMFGTLVGIIHRISTTPAKT